TVLLVKPQTFMNDSGKAVRALVEKDGLRPEEILVIYDDLDLAPGRIRVRAQGSSGGHRGIRSIQEQLAALWRSRGAALPAGAGAPQFEAAAPAAGVAVATAKGVRPEPPAFPRIKVGIGRPPAGVDPIDFVLTRFDPHELLVMQPAIERAAEAAAYWVHAGAEATANRFNAG
ncbi:MAG TPA: aminoacyl-tRNA hydrolase, partial [Chloroflexota bacterium]|nr:aminoacyl-tRNA hydrolase [Chloroflexota bacterium]